MGYTPNLPLTNHHSHATIPINGNLMWAHGAAEGLQKAHTTNCQLSRSSAMPYRYKCYDYILVYEHCICVSVECPRKV